MAAAAKAEGKAEAKAAGKAAAKAKGKAAAKAKAKAKAKASPKRGAAPTANADADEGGEKSVVLSESGPTGEVVVTCASSASNDVQS